MENIYIASLNPMHFSHLNTWERAQEILGSKVFLCIGQNMAKTSGLFSLEERAEIAIKYYNIPIGQVVLLYNQEEIISAILNAKRIVRGIRNEKDWLELRQLVELYNVKDQERKILDILVPPDLVNISSRKLIEKISNHSYRREDNWIPGELINVIYNKITLMTEV